MAPDQPAVGVITRTGAGPQHHQRGQQQQADRPQHPAASIDQPQRGCDGGGQARCPRPGRRIATRGRETSVRTRSAEGSNDDRRNAAGSGADQCPRRHAGARHAYPYPAVLRRTRVRPVGYSRRVSGLTRPQCHRRWQAASAEGSSRWKVLELRMKILIQWRQRSPARRRPGHRRLRLHRPRTWSPS